MAASVASAATVTTLDGSQGWQAPDTRPGGTAKIVDLAGEGGALENDQPAPTGAVRLTTDGTNAAKAEVGIAGNFGLVSDILGGNISLSCSWFDEGGGGGTAAPSIKLAFLNNSYSGDGNGQLVYEPYAQGSGTNSYITPAVDGWVTANIDLTNGRFWNTGMFGVGTSSAGPPNRTLADWLTQFDSGFAGASLVGIAVGIGTYNPGETGYFDQVSISTAGHGRGTWNFEAAPASVVPVPAALPLLLGALALVRRRAHP